MDRGLSADIRDGASVQYPVRRIHAGADEKTPIPKTDSAVNAVKADLSPPRRVRIIPAPPTDQHAILAELAKAPAVNPIRSTRKRITRFRKASGSQAPCVGSPSAITLAEPMTASSGKRSLKSAPASIADQGIACSQVHFTNSSCCACADTGAPSTRKTQPIKNARRMADNFMNLDFSASRGRTPSRMVPRGPLSNKATAPPSLPHAAPDIINKTCPKAPRNSVVTAGSAPTTCAASATAPA